MFYFHYTIGRLDKKPDFSYNREGTRKQRTEKEINMDIDANAFDLTTPRTEEEYETLFEQMFAEMDRMNARMRIDQIIIDRNHEDTRRSAIETRAILDRMEAKR